MKKVASVKLAEIEICCSLGSVDRKFPEAKSPKNKNKRYDDLKFKKRLFLNT